tara:strand:- start:1528 stop:2721 length:1194 start_codon:yes stop_codon:yes gene_type:complete
MEKKKKKKLKTKKKKLSNLTRSKKKGLKNIRKRTKRIKKKKFKNKHTKINLKRKKLKKQKKTNQTENFISQSVRFEENLKSKFKFKFNFNILVIDKFILKFFQKIEEKINEFKSIRIEEKKRIKIETIERREKEKLEIKKQKEAEIATQIKLKEQQLKDEEKIEKQRAKDIKLFLRKEQAILRKEQAERQRNFLQELKLEKQIEKFRVREVKELEKLEKISLREKREDYAGLQDRIEKLKNKYRLIRDQKIRERVEALGVKTQEGDDRAILLQKEREYNLARQKIELALESFYRSANSLVFQLNKRYITKHMSILRCIDRRFETGEIFIKWDESSDDEWLILIYIKDNAPDKGIIIEDKSNKEKNLSYEFKPSEIFKASDTMVDSLTQLISIKRNKG